MKIPYSWLKEYVDVTPDLEALARTLTMIGLEVDGITLVGMPKPAGDRREFKYSGLSWDREKIVVAEIREVLPHPNADRLVLCRLFDGREEHQVLTGAPNLFEYKNGGELQPPLKVAYAREGAQIYDGHQPGQELTTLKRAKIRGVDSYSMVCSEKELGISEEHEGILLFDADAPTGLPLADYLGDAVLELSILPNMSRNACVLGVARELAAVTGLPLKKSGPGKQAAGPAIAGQASLDIQVPELNPRFVAGLLRDAEIRPSPFLVQLRLKLAGMRPINNIVDATNYVMLETGQPLHAFDYDALLQRNGGKPPTLLTRQAQPGEKLTTLDGVERKLDDFTVLVCDTHGALSIAGVMGGSETEVSPATRNILLEGASWNLINIRRTTAAQKLASEAGYRFSRGVHPALAEVGVSRCLDLMQRWSGGEVASGLLDAYPLRQPAAVVELSTGDIRRILGIELSADSAAEILSRLEFRCTVKGDTVTAVAPDFRLDIGSGITGRADLLEEIARIYGYDRIPETRLRDEMPPQRGNPGLEREERLRDVLANLGLQEVVSYRLTTPEREARLTLAGKPGAEEYIALQNPITPERRVMRRSMLASVMDALERNARTAGSLALFELGSVYLPAEGQTLPAEPARLAIALAGRREEPAWDAPEPPFFDFFDLKGILEQLAAAFHLPALQFEASANPAFHPGQQAAFVSGTTRLGEFGALHPVVRGRYDTTYPEILGAEIDLDAFFTAGLGTEKLVPVPAFPPILEDIAVIVAESVPAGTVEALIRQTGGKLLTTVRLFDIFRGPQVGEGQKSLAYSLTYQAPDRTLTDQEATQVRQRIVRRLEQELGARLRG